MKSVRAGERRRRLAAVHCAKRDLGLDDASYRALLAGAAGVESAAQLRTGRQWEAVLRALRRAGWRGTGRLTGQLGACYALWCELHRLGAVRRRSYAALMAYVRRQCGEQDIYRVDQLSSVIESLKAWRDRVTSSPTK